MVHFLLVFILGVSGLVAQVDEGVQDRGPVWLPLSSESVGALEEMYGITRGEADCCGVSTVEVFLRKDASLGVLEEEVEGVLRHVAKSEEPVDWLLKTRGVMGLDAPEPYDLKSFLFPVARHAVVLEPQRQLVASEIGSLVGDFKVFGIFSAPLEPAPSVDGTVDVAVTPDGKFLLVRVMDEGA